MNINDLGYEQNAQLRERLIHSNISFATEISSLQDNFNKEITNLVSKIVSLTDKKENITKYVTVSLMPPVVLLLQLIETSITSVTNIVATFQNFPGMKISPLYLLKRYVPYLDWDEVMKASQDDEAERILKTPTDGQQPPGGGRGGF